MPVGDYTIAQCDYGNPFTAAVKVATIMVFSSTQSVRQKLALS